MNSTLPLHKISEHEAEQASNAYLMSLIAIVAGVPLPIINLLATLGFYLANRKKSYYIRWHCTQALLGQLSCFFFNSYGFWWTVGIIFFDKDITLAYIIYISFVIFINVVEFIITIYAAIEVRKRVHVEWWFLGALTNRICSKDSAETET